MTHANRARLNLNPIERDLLHALERPNTRWHTPTDLAAHLAREIPVVLSGLNNLRRRDLVTVRVVSIHPDGQAEWSITTQGSWALQTSTQLSLLSPGGIWRNA